MVQKKPVGAITRGTTNPNRLRRVDRYLTTLDIWRKISDPLVVDLGYGKTPVTALELLTRMQKVNSKVKVLGIEIDPERVLEAKPLETSYLAFCRGGFEIPIPSEFCDRDQVDLIRAFNVLRQYEVVEVQSAWKLMLQRLSPDGFLVEGTSDEIGRVSSWITLNKDGPIEFTISLRLAGLTEPSKVAERLPKILIHRNTPGNRIYEYLRDFDQAWVKSAALASFGPAQRFAATCEAMIAAGWPIARRPARFRLGEVSLPYSAIAP